MKRAAGCPSTGKLCKAISSKELFEFCKNYLPIMYLNIENFNKDILSEYNYEDLSIISNTLLNSDLCIFNHSCNKQDRNFIIDNCKDCMKSIKDRSARR